MNRRRTIKILIPLLILFAAVASAQTTASITGTVTAQGKPLPGVTVTATSPNLQGERTTSSDVNGNFTLGAVPPGDYTVRFDLSGMQSATRQLHVGPAQTGHADADLKMQTVETSITVTSAPAVVETTEIQTNMPQSLVNKLPVSRTLISTVDLTPGTTRNGPANATMISGAMSFESEFYMDGSVINEVLRGQPNNLFIEDAIQETTVQTGSISAEFGRFTGGVVTAITKNGGNEFSGSLRDSISNPKWTSQTPLKEPRPDSKMFNIYEGTLGGKIVRDRLWFFTAGRYRKRDQQESLFRQPQNTYTFTDKERRLQGKLTGQIGSKHTIVGTYLDIKQDQVNNCFGNCYETISLDSPRKLPNSFATVNYTGIFTNNFLVEASFARQQLQFVGGGGFPTGDRATSSVIITSQGSIAGPAPFCNGCSFPEERPNRNFKLKGSYLMSSSGLGTHNLTGGYEDFQDRLKSNNHQSASDFEIFTIREPQILANGTVAPIFPRFGAFVVWWPILQSSLGNRFTSRSAFLNDKWDFNNRLSFNLGVRYDKNTGVNEAHQKVADDSLVSPRLGVTYDTFGDGRFRINGSYSVYTSKIANGNIGDATSAAGQPSILYWLYGGPTISGVNSTEALRQAFAWFDSVGGIKNTSFLAGGGTAGISTQIPSPLRTPSVSEFTVGVGSNFNPKTFFRVDYQHRKFKDFYTSVTNTSTGQVLDPLIGIELDRTFLVNSNDLRRSYNAVILQGGYQPFSRLNIGGNYTYSKLRGNINGETANSGPVPTNGPQQYPEFQGFAQNNPVGFLPADQRHKFRGWVSYDINAGNIGTFNITGLQRYDSGTHYSLIGTIDPVQSEDCPQCVDPAKFSYLNPPHNVNYFFSQRGAGTYDNIMATDLALNYLHPVGTANFFANAQVLNVFNRHGRVAFNTDVIVTELFNPFTETPVEGVNWVKGDDFGKAQNPTSLFTQGDYQLPRSYRFSFGLRF